jgi:hypothetical protein
LLGWRIELVFRGHGFRSEVGRVAGAVGFVN